MVWWPGVEDGCLVWTSCEWLASNWISVDLQRKAWVWVEGPGAEFLVAKLLVVLLLLLPR